jgi:hypothetical protein
MSKPKNRRPHVSSSSILGASAKPKALLAFENRFPLPSRVRRTA